MVSVNTLAKEKKSEKIAEKNGVCEQITPKMAIFGFSIGYKMRTYSPRVKI